jgi:hypothetical protein
VFEGNIKVRQKYHILNENGHRLYLKLLGYMMPAGISISMHIYFNLSNSISLEKKGATVISWRPHDSKV